MKNTTVLLKKYLYQPAHWWTGILTAFGVAQLLIGRNNQQAIYFFLAALVVTALSFFFAFRSNTQREKSLSLIIFLIPAVAIALYAAVAMQKETSQEDYSEIVNGLKSAKTEIDRRLLVLSVMDAMQDGKISRWEGNALRNDMFERNGFLFRSDVKSTQQEARQELQATIDKLKPLVVVNMSKITKDDGIYSLISVDGKCKYQLILKVPEKPGKMIADVINQECQTKQGIVRDTSFKGSIVPVGGYAYLPIESGTKLYVFVENK